MAGGGKIGNQNAAKGRLFEDGLLRAIKAKDALAKEDGVTLRRIAEELLDKGLAGDVNAITQIRDTLDGKPKQRAELTGEDGSPLFAEVVRKLIK